MRGRDLVVIRWTLAGKTKEAVTLRVRPMVSGRDDYHATHHMNDRLLTTATTVAGGLVSWRPYGGLSSVQGFQNGELPSLRTIPNPIKNPSPSPAPGNHDLGGPE
ncbi:MAG: glycogen debranching enzyme N-terminal domain-containing protein, partial [Nitrosospira sp.]|nr:glycogen debranching enzyme N-terminal domain-containing protein [Nitrosospira sp.]